MPEEGYSGGIASEGTDVVAHPFYCETLVEEAEVKGAARISWEAEDIQAVTVTVRLSFKLSTATYLKDTTITTI